MTGVWHDEAGQAWLLEMRSTGYALGLADGGACLRHLYWGPALPREAVNGLASAGRDAPGAWERRISWGRELPDEYVPWGGLRFDEPSLKAEFADGTRAVEWRFAGHRVGRRDGAATLEVDLTDAAYGLLVTLWYRIFDGFDVIERWAAIRNRGDRPVVIRQAHSANWWMRAGRRWRLRYLHGGWAAETQLTETMLGPGKLVLESRRGTTSHQLNPWFTLDPDGASTEERGEVWSGALAWSGSWKIVCETTAAGRVHACGGLNDFDWAHELTPGEELVVPSFAGLHTAGGFGAASREWHAWQRAHVLGRGERAGVARPRFLAGPRPDRAQEPVPGRASGAEPAPAASTPAPAPGHDGPPLRPVLYNSWEATGFAVSEDGQARLAELAARLGVECFVVDDGWFAGRDHDRAGLGDWTPDRAKFPRGLTPLIERVGALGMRFGLWVEPEMVNPDSDLYRAHPDWVYHFENRSRTEQRHQLVLNLARPDVADWVFQTLDGLLSAHDIGFIKWDMNRPISEPGWPGAAGRNPERIWVEHVRNLYAILDALRAAHPGTDFESCSGGGGRVDLGILGRVAQVWTSDNTDAWDRVAIQEGFTQVYPAQVMAAWVTDSPNFLTGRRLPLSLRFHVAMAGALGIGGDLLRWDEAELAEAAGLVARYKQIRPVIQRGRLYRIASARRDPVAASQYLAGDGSAIVVLCWWGPDQCGTRMFRPRLSGLDPAASYQDEDTGAKHTGAALLNAGLPMPGGADFGSALIRLRRG